AAVTENDELSSTVKPFAHTQSGVADFFPFFGGHLRAEKGIIANFHLNRSSDFSDDVHSFLLVFSEERVEKAGVADVVAQFAALKENVNGFPKRVVKNFDEFLVDERVLRGGLREIRAFVAWERKCHCAPLPRRVQCGPDFRIAFGWTETHNDVVWLQQGFDPRLESARQIESRKGALANDHRMHELHGDMLRVRGVRSAPKRQKPAA